MIITLDVGTIITSVLSGGALIGIAAILRQLKDINGNIRELQSWKGSHEKLNDERHNTQIIENKSIWDAIQWIRDRLSG